MTPGRIMRPQGGGPQPVLSAEQVAEAVALYGTGDWTVTELAERFYVHQTTMSRYLHGAGCPVRSTPPPPRPLTTEELLRTLQLAAEGFSARDIAAIMRLHTTTVRERLRRNARPDMDWRWRRHRLPERLA